MIATPLRPTHKWQFWLLLLFFAINAIPILTIRLWVNPSFLFDELIISNIDDQTALLICFPSIATYEGIKSSAPSKSKKQILSVLGSPKFKEQNLSFPGCNESLNKVDEVWFYEVAPHALILIGFNGELCVLARGFEGREDIDYQTWKTRQLKVKAIGKTPEEIEAWLGPCFVKYPEIVEQILVATGQKSALISSTDMRGEFWISTGSVIDLEVKNGRCVKAEAMAVFY